MQNNHGKDDFLTFKVEDEVAPKQEQLEPWLILIADDDDQVHKVTELALTSIEVLGRRLSFLHAYTGAEALALVRQNPGIALILLDVVMESDDAGLQLVRRIRDELLNDTVRIILRTGQPGYAPELEVIQLYDVNDYKMKSEFTRTRLITTITTTIRSYEQLRNSQAVRKALELIIEGTANLIFEVQPEILSKAILELIVEAIPDLGQAQIFRYNGEYQGLKPIAALDPENRKIVDGTANSSIDFSESLQQAMRSEHSVFIKNDAVLVFNFDEHSTYYLALRSEKTISDSENRIIRVLTSTAQLSFRNVALIQRLKRHAYRDQLTGLHNKRKFVELIDSLTGEERKASVLAIIDIDSFSELNDSLGFEAGNAILNEVADRLRAIDIDELIIARISGDIFAMFGEAKKFKPQLILSAFDDPVLVKDLELPVHSSVGLINMSDEMLAEDAIKFANMAMKRSKLESRGRFRFFNESMEAQTLLRLQVSRELKPALLASEFFLQLQPQVNLITGAVVGAESLIRWRKKDGEVIPPFNFIPIAEESGMINELGNWVLLEATKILADWKSRGLNLRLSVNVSLRQLHNPTFATMIREFIHKAGIAPEFLELELTESVLMKDSERVVEILKQLKELGIGIAIDDFGTGFSSLSYLLTLPIDRLKVDRSFILNLETDKKAYLLTELVVNMGRNLGLEIIAEGVESEKQALIVKQLGCHEVQGYHYGRPMDRPDFETWLEGQAVRPAKTGAQ